MSGTLGNDLLPTGVLLAEFPFQFPLSADRRDARSLGVRPSRGFFSNRAHLAEDCDFGWSSLGTLTRVKQPVSGYYPVPQETTLNRQTVSSGGMFSGRPLHLVLPVEPYSLQE